MATRYKVTKNTELAKAIEINAQKLVTDIFHIDSLIENYAHELNRAQPLLSGKVCLVFANGFSHKVDNQRISFKKPFWGRLVKRKSGPWFFRVFNKKEKFQISGAPSYTEGIQSMRVGRNFKSDYTVRRLISRICTLIETRDEITATVSKMRTDLYNTGRKSESLVYDYYEELQTISNNIEMDWLNNANECYQSLSKDVKKAKDAVCESSDEESISDSK